MYDYYVLRYGCFLKNIRYEEYDVNKILYRSMNNGVKDIGSAQII